MRHSTNTRQHRQRPVPSVTAEYERGLPVSKLSESRFLTVQEVADLMRVSSMTVYRLIKSGDLRAVRVGRSFRVRQEDIDGYLETSYTQTG
ncbi:MAG: helix-turn-helix domain-containing protein [Actinobacteria bacterium]|nr:helix-turn-helix domain-containing protein [Actinomycetota bacterium]